GEAFKLDVAIPARDAARAFATDQIASLYCFDFAGGVLDFDRNAVGGLFEIRELRRHQHRDKRMLLRHRKRFFDDLDALALQHEWELRVVGKMLVIEFGDDRRGLPIPVLKPRSDNAPPNELLVQPDPV